MHRRGSSGTAARRAGTRYATAKYALGVACALQAPPEWVIDCVHVYNIVFRLAVLVLGIVLYSDAGFYPSPLLTVSAYSYAAWDEVAGPGDVLPSPLVMLPPDGMLLAVVWFMLTTACLVGDGERFLSKVCGVRGNRIDYEWHVIMAVVWPLLVLFVALLLGTHNILVLVAVTLLSAFTGVVAQLAENITKLVNLEEGGGSGFTSYALPTLRTWHDWMLAMTTLIVLFPLLCNSATDRAQVSPLRGMVGACLVCLALSFAVIQRAHHHFLKRVQRTWPCRLLREHGWSEAAQLASSPGAAAPSGKLHNLFRKLAAPRVDRGEELYENLYGARVYSEGAATDGFRSSSGYKDMPDDTFNRLYGCQVAPATAEITPPPSYEISADLQYLPNAGSRGRDALAPRHNPYSSVDTHEEDARCARMRVAYLVEWRRHYVLNILVNVVLLASLLEMDASGGGATFRGAHKRGGTTGGFAANAGQ